MKVFQISSELNVGSVGKISEQIGESILKEGWQSFIAYGREGSTTTSKAIKIGNKLGVYFHVLMTRLTDKHGHFSFNATNKLIDCIDAIRPDIIHLHHLHGYFINIEVLFKYLQHVKIPVVWTFHDCWSFTGHCAYYDQIGCAKWKDHCRQCPQIQSYPKSLLLDRSESNFTEKKNLFTSVPNLTIVPVSYWLADETKKSFFKECQIRVIQNGIDIDKFSYRENEVRPKFNIGNKFMILGVASPWDIRKGLKYFIELYDKLSSDYQIVLIGLSARQISELPTGIIGLEKTNSIEELANFYSSSDVFVNPTLEEALGLTNIESLSCGTPVITFNSGGSPETIDRETGIVVEKGDIEGLKSAIEEIKEHGKEYYFNNCRKRAELHFKKQDRFSEYIALYKELLNLSENE
ncbi:glycosyl transferase [Sphingobacterium sp. ML3W]|uniref:glycosyltransferase n=1 Tax=Sphingobacterium sp. ML3W TaxID=1538644 RepID=UPI0004F603F9|nr:glycosyltransferase [Sphingobacterium sp. ML3W]AIM39168.1 glycosyl transferase [Sphingobacterium sp. ML3W]